MAKKGKAANGEGSVFFHRRTGRWVCELVIGTEVVTGPDGKPVLDEKGLPKTRRKVIRFSSERKSEVQAWRVQKLKELQDGTLVEPSRETLGQFLDRWLETVVQHEVKPATVQNYREMVEFYLKPGLGAVPLQKLTPPQIQAFYHQLLTSPPPRAKDRGRTLSPRTVQLVHAVLHRALGQAVQWGLLARNPADAVKKPRVERKEFTALTPEQVAQFLEAARDDRLHALFTLAVLTGLRLGELLALRWSDIDLEAGTVTVARTLEKDGPRWTFGEPKTKSSRRTVDLPAPAVAALRQWHREQAKERLMVGEAWADPDLVFTTKIGTPLLPGNVRNRHFHEILEKAGLPKIRFHDLRHTYATLMIAGGVGAKVLQELLGHSRVGITLDIYTHTLREQKKEAVQKVEALLEAAQRKQNAR